MKGSRLAEGFDEIRIPGEGSARRARESTARGIVLAPAVVAELDGLAARMKVPALDRNHAP